MVWLKRTLMPSGATFQGSLARTFLFSAPASYARSIPGTLVVDEEAEVAEELLLLLEVVIKEISPSLEVQPMPMHVDLDLLTELPITAEEELLLLEVVIKEISPSHEVQPMAMQVDLDLLMELPITAAPQTTMEVVWIACERTFLENLVRTIQSTPLTSCVS